MSSHAAEKHASHFDEHGHKDHGHTIVSIWTLRAVLGTLVFFTLLTSGAAYLEEFIAYSLQIEFPQMVNVVVAMSIAVIKATIVVMFFMQLKYDNPINAAVLFFTIFAVLLFLLYTLMDLHKRDTIDFFKGQEIVYGGTGVGGAAGPVAAEARKAAAINNPGLLHEPHHEHLFSSADHSRPVVEVTLEGYADEHTDAHGGHGGDAAAPAEEAGGH